MAGFRDFFGKAAGTGAAARPPATPRPGTVVLKPKDAPKPQGRDILLTPKSAGPVGTARPPAPAHVKQVTPAAIVYALAAGVLFVLAAYNLLHGSIFNGIVTFVPAGGLAVLAYKYIQ